MFNIEKIARPCITQGHTYVPGKPIEEVEKEYGITNIAKLASNENPFGASKMALEAMIEEMRTRIHLYPESSCTLLREKLADLFGLNPWNFFIDNGLDGVITMIGLTFLLPDDEVITSDLTFPAYRNITQKMGAKYISIPSKDDFSCDIDGIIQAVTPNTKIVFICNPNNPTGTIIGKDAFARLMNAVPDTALVVSDEAYFEFVQSTDYPDTIPYIATYPNLMVLRTFSKLMGIAGIRVGYAVADESIVKMMMKAREPFPVNRAAQAGALASLEDKAFFSKVLEHTKAEKEFLREKLTQFGFSVAESHTNFLFVRLNRPAENLYEKMLAEGIIVRPFSYSEEDFFRITIGTTEENRKLLSVFAKLLR